MSKDNLVWKLINKEGYFSEYIGNKVFYEKYFINDIVSLSEIDATGDGFFDGWARIIYAPEFKYFEPVKQEEINVSKKVLDKLEAGKTYRLIDAKGYQEGPPPNCDIIKEELTCDLKVTLDRVVFNLGGYKGEVLVIALNEIKYFELVEDITTPPVKEESQIWDGVSVLEVGMVVTRYNVCNKRYKVEFIKGDHVFLSEECRDENVILTLAVDLRSLLPSPKEQFCELMFNKVRGSTMDFAHSTTWDIRELSKLCYEELMEGK